MPLISASAFIPKNTSSNVKIISLIEKRWYLDLCSVFNNNREKLSEAIKMSRLFFIETKHEIDNNINTSRWPLWQLINEEDSYKNIEFIFELRNNTTQSNNKIYAICSNSDPRNEYFHKGPNIKNYENWRNDIHNKPLIGKDYDNEAILVNNMGIIESSTCSIIKLTIVNDKPVLYISAEKNRVNSVSENILIEAAHSLGIKCLRENFLPIANKKDDLYIAVNSKHDLRKISKINYNEENIIYSVGSVLEEKYYLLKNKWRTLAYN